MQITILMVICDWIFEMVKGASPKFCLSGRVKTIGLTVFPAKVHTIDQWTSCACSPFSVMG